MGNNVYPIYVSWFMVNVFYVTAMIRFFECERNCDEDPCCRGIGFVRDTGASGMNMLQLLQ